MTRPRFRLHRLDGPIADVPSRLEVTAVRVLDTFWDAVCGLVLLLPTDTFGTNPGYRVLLELFRSDWTCGLPLLLIAVLRLFAMTVPTRWATRHRIAGAVSLSGVLLWGTMSLGILIAVPASLGAYIYLGVAAAHGWSYAQALNERANPRIQT